MESQILKDFNFFQVVKEKYINPRNGKPVSFYHLKLSDWTIVLPITPSQEILMIKQFRPGAKKFFYEFPGGLINKNENPEEAAKRELFEETGYKANNLELLNVSYPLPAFQTSKCYIFIAKDVERASENLKLDDGEDIELLLVSSEKAKNMLLKGELENSMMALALSLAITLHKL